MNVDAGMVLHGSRLGRWKNSQGEGKDSKALDEGGDEAQHIFLVPRPWPLDIGPKLISHFPLMLSHQAC